MTEDTHLLVRLDERVKALEKAESQRSVREWALIVAVIVALVNGFLERFTNTGIDEAAIRLLGIVF